MLYFIFQYQPYIYFDLLSLDIILLMNVRIRQEGNRAEREIKCSTGALRKVKLLPYSHKWGRLLRMDMCCIRNWRYSRKDCIGIANKVVTDSLLNVKINLPLFYLRPSRHRKSSTRTSSNPCRWYSQRPLNVCAGPRVAGSWWRVWAPEWCRDQFYACLTP